MPKAPIWSQDKYLDAFHFAALAHRGQKYPGTGLPYMLHISEVCMETIAALEVEGFKDPDLAVQCALLHDVIEDTKVGKRKIKGIFGADVADGVVLLSKDNRIKNKDKRFHEYMLQLQGARKEVRLVKLADRVSNLQTPSFHWDQKKIADYLDKSKAIVEMLGDASPYLSKRLQKKIRDYTVHIAQE